MASPRQMAVCPVPATTASLGAEAPLGGGACTQRYGFVPWSTLGLSGPINSDNLLMDNWLSPYRYNITNQNASAFTTLRSDERIDNSCPQSEFAYM